MQHIDPGTIMIWLGSGIALWLCLELFVFAIIIGTAAAKWTWRWSKFGAVMVTLGFDRLPATVPSPDGAEPDLNRKKLSN
ncbi:MAG TPA: hypothetical protein VMX97_02505 [Hyphomicrobiaceae bacterium]|nr:hypothetical protein [Hyphomicrobiaceae bacterium]